MGEPIPLSVWPTAQQTSRNQRAGRYTAASIAHPAKMLPAIARHAITAYTNRADVVVDPMCGIGTTLVEAVHLNRRAVGVEYEARWANLARANLHFAATQGAAGTGEVHTGDGRDLPQLLPADLHGRVALVLTSPPYGASVHGHVTATPDQGVAKRNDRYTSSRAGRNLAHASADRLLDAFTGILAAARGVLRPNGVVAITTRPWRRDGVLVDFPAAVVAAAAHAGLTLVERNVALLAGLRGDRLVPRASFFQLTHVRNARARGTPAPNHRPRRRPRLHARRTSPGHPAGGRPPRSRDVTGGRCRTTTASAERHRNPDANDRRDDGGNVDSAAFRPLARALLAIALERHASGRLDTPAGTRPHRPRHRETTGGPACGA